MKKNILLIASLLLFVVNGFAQDKDKDNGTLLKKKLVKVYVTKDVSLHFVSPEPIQYADISTKSIVGDLPVKNVLRLKFVPDAVKEYGFVNRSLGVVTVVGEKFIAQYDVWYTENEDNVQTQIEILPSQTNPLDVGAIPMSQNQLHDFAIKALVKKGTSHAVRSSAMGMEAKVNNVYTVDDYVFLDITYTNVTRLKYDIDEIRFKIDDKRIVKATNVQAIELKPAYQLYEKTSFKNKYRNIFVFKKFTFPDNKILTVEMTEKQVSGRVITLQLDYSDLLNADTL